MAQKVPVLEIIGWQHVVEMAISGQEHPGVGYKIINIKLFCRVNGKKIFCNIFSQVKVRLIFLNLLLIVKSIFLMLTYKITIQFRLNDLTDKLLN